MTSRSAPLLFAAITLAGLLATIRVVAWPIVVVALPERSPETAQYSAPSQVVAAESVSTVVVVHDLFRVNRRPAAVPYDPERAAQPPAPQAPKPTLVLAGIVWDGGVDPSAVVEGLPGVDGARVGALRIRLIAPDRVVIAGQDTVWTLGVTQPWK